MAEPPPRPPRRRPRRGSVERPVNARTYRGTWLLAGLPLLVAAFSVSRAQPLPPPELPPTFDGEATRVLARDLATRFPERAAGSRKAADATRWVADRFRVYGLQAHRERFEADVPGRGRVTLTNLAAVVPGRSDATIVVSAHRDDLGLGRGANDNASGTAVLIELARTYARVGSTGRQVVPANRIVFLSTDGGASGGLGAAHFAEHSPYRERTVAVVNLDSLAGGGRPRLVLAGDAPRSPPTTLLQTAAARVLDETGQEPAHASAAAQLVDLAFPFTLHEQGPFLARGVPAITLTTGAEHPPPSLLDSPARLDVEGLAELGQAAQQLLVSLDEGVEPPQGTAPIVYFGPRVLPGWAVELVLIAAILPFVAAAVDLFAHLRRRGIALAPALRSYRSRLLFWLLAGVLFGAFSLLGAWPHGVARPLPPETHAAQDWPLLQLGALAALVGFIWLVARDPLLPRRPIARSEELAGYAAALLVLGLVSLLVIATNAFALIFLLPSLHAWLWLPHVHDRRLPLRLGVLAAGFAGPLVLLWSLAARAGVGLDAPWYLLALVGIGYVDVTTVVVFLAWLAAAAQLAALTAGRYAPYPSRAERRARGPLRELVRRLVLALRRGRSGAPAEHVRAVGD